MNKNIYRKESKQKWEKSTGASKESKARRKRKKVKVTKNGR